MNDQKLHNPDNLTPEQIGTAEGWRLLAKDEVFGNSIPPINSYGCLCRKWFDDGREHGEMWGSITYRTKLTRAELRAARGLPPETEATASDTPRSDAIDIEILEGCYSPQAKIGLWRRNHIVLERELAKVTAARDANDSDNHETHCQKCGTGLRYCGPQDPVTHIPEVQCPLCNAIAERDEARAQLAAARADSARLDWLEAATWNDKRIGNGIVIAPYTISATNERRYALQALGGEDGSNLGEELEEGASLRAAIDAAKEAK